MMKKPVFGGIERIFLMLPFAFQKEVISLCVIEQKIRDMMKKSMFFPQKSADSFCKALFDKWKIPDCLNVLFSTECPV